MTTWRDAALPHTLPFHSPQPAHHHRRHHQRSSHDAPKPAGRPPTGAAAVRLDVRDVARGGADGVGHDAGGGPLAELGAKGGEDVGAAAAGAQGDGPAAAAGQHEGRGAVVVGVAVGVGADGLGGAAVVAAGAARGGVVVVAGAAVAVRARLLARRQARVEGRPRDVVVRVRVDAVAGLGRLRGLQVPGAPVPDARARLRRLVGHGVRGVGVPGGAGAVRRGEVARGGDAGRRDEVRRRRLRAGVGGGGVGEVLEPERDVVPVDDGDVDEVLVGRDAGGEVELGECCGGVSLWRPVV